MTSILALLCLLAAGQTSECRRQRMTAKLEQSVRDYQAVSVNTKETESSTVSVGLPETLTKSLPQWTKQEGFPDWMSSGLIIIPSGITLFMIMVLAGMLIKMKTASVSSSGEEEVVSPVSELVGKVVSIAIPTAIANTLFMLCQVFNMIILGHVGSTQQIAAIGLGNTMQNCFGMIVGAGMITGLDPLCSGATGAGDEKMAATYLQRCRCVVTLQLIWMVPLLMFTEPLLVLIGQNPDVSSDASHYNQISSIGLFFFFNMFSMMSWLRARGENTVPVLMWACIVCLHVPSCFLWVAVLGMGNFGCGLANTISYALGCLAIHWYGSVVAKKSNVPLKSVLWIEADGLKGWGEFCSVSVPAMLQSCTEMWYFEIVTFVTGYLGAINLASWVSAYTVYSLLQMPCMGISTGASVVVGFALGQKRPQEAKALTVTSLSMVYILGMIIAGLLIVLRLPVCWIFNDLPEVHVVMSNILILMAVTCISDYAQTTMAGILRGQLRSGITVVGFIVAFWLISMPTGLSLGFPFGYGVYGLAFANCIGSSLAALIFGVSLLMLDTDAIALEMEERMASEKAQIAVTDKPSITAMPRGSVGPGRASVIVQM